MKKLSYRLFSAVILGALISIPSGWWGEALPREKFNFDAFPFKPYKWERNGKIYNILKIRRWRKYLPDRSKWNTKMFRKTLDGNMTPENMRRLIQETCVSEFVHGVLILISPIFMLCIGGNLGSLLSFLYAVGNLPFVIIQRYNRPKLITLLKKLESQAKSVCQADINTVL